MAASGKRVLSWVLSATAVVLACFLFLAPTAEAQSATLTKTLDAMLGVSKNKMV